MFGKYKSPLGMITFEVDQDKLIGMTIEDLDVKVSSNAVITNILGELDRYFKHESKQFHIDIKWMRGTPFQQKVWSELLKIPYGETRSYQEIAIASGSPKGVRAVGQACKKNPIGIVVPCHRVIGKDGSMTGYSGKAYIDLKQKLISFEQAY